MSITFFSHDFFTRNYIPLHFELFKNHFLENVYGYLFPQYKYEYLANLIIKAVENKRFGYKSRINN